MDVRSVDGDEVPGPLRKEMASVFPQERTELENDRRSGRRADFDLTRVIAELI
jgi:hypothetical protein